jgi:hypothetical protein
MKKQLFVICVFVTASFFNSKSFAQTFPSNYVPLSPQLVHGSFPLPDNSPFVLPTDLIEGFRSTALPNGGQDISEIGYLPLSAFASASQLTHFQQQLTTQLQQQDNLDRYGIATALAMTNASMPSAPDLTSWTMNATEYRGEQALGGALAHRFNTTVPFAIHVGFAISGSTRTVSAGFQGEF